MGYESALSVGEALAGLYDAGSPAFLYFVSGHHYVFGLLLVCFRQVDFSVRLA
jgi:hypothetical protein